MTPRREDSFIYKNPENLYKRSVHFRKNRRRESDFRSSLSSENYILDPKHKTGNIGEEVKHIYCIYAEVIFDKHIYKTHTRPTNLKATFN